MATKYLVIVESPAKCKTISKFLGKDYTLLASYGHVRDLPGKTLGVAVDENFTPTYVSMKDKSNVIKDIKTAAKAAETVYLATDPDREGEAIAWHIVEATKLPATKTKRIVFNEISEHAIKDAITASRNIDTDLVDAQQARRILDRLIGYKLSPLLSRKIQKGLSAGRVQSVTVKIICDREAAIEAFIPEEYWNIDARLKDNNSNVEFTARLFAKDSKESRFQATKEQEATAVKDSIESSSIEVNDVVKSRIKRNSPLPFITSTLQQEASRKLNWSAKKTMMVAQKLYEGQNIDGESTGLITYMRTDSTRISDTAINEAREFITKTYSKDYIGFTKTASTKKKAAIQDAHEAIRPVSTAYPPKKTQATLSPDHQKLYTLIWNRFIASQMTAAQYDRTQIILSSNSQPAYYLRATGSILVFDGFTRIYSESSDDVSDDKKQDNDNQLPDLVKGQKPSILGVDAEQKFTQPPPRFTEASLVKELEELGIGRPSTYAPTLSTIQDRGYVDKDQKRLFPTELGRVTNLQLESFFADILDLSFTASMETKLDDIQEGKYSWQDIVGQYYNPLTGMIDHAKENMERVSVGERQLGVDPKTGRELIVKIGRYGPMAQLGKAEDEEKPVFAGIGDDMDIKTITLEEALSLFDFPKTLGQYESLDIVVNRGRFGPYVKFNNAFVSIPDSISIHNITLDEAIELIEEKKKKDKERIIHDFNESEPHIQVLNGRYGPYITMNKKNYKIPKDTDPKTLTRDECIHIIDNQPEPKKRGKRRKKKS